MNRGPKLARKGLPVIPIPRSHRNKLVNLFPRMVGHLPELSFLVFYPLLSFRTKRLLHRNRDQYSRFGVRQV